MPKQDHLSTIIKRSFNFVILLMTMALICGCTRSRAMDWAQLSPSIKPTIAPAAPVVMEHARLDRVDTVDLTPRIDSNTH